MDTENQIKPKRKSKEVVVDRQISKLTKELKIIHKSYSVNGSKHLIFENIPTELLIDDTTEKGRRVLASIYPDTHEVYLVRYHKPGEQSFPYGGIKIYNKTLDEQKYVYPECVVKHKNSEFFNRMSEYDKL